MRRVRRWAAGLDWPASAGLRPSAGRAGVAVDPGWPVLSASEFASLLERATDGRNRLVDDEVDRDPSAVDAVDQTDAAACDVLALFRSGPDPREEEDAGG